LRREQLPSRDFLHLTEAFHIVYREVQFQLPLHIFEL